jgi:pimeloyl-ACP methyl ester carboxylesterase
MTLIQIAPGRVLELEVTGPDHGFPFVMQHGTPGSLVRFRPIEAAVHRRGLRMVTYSRPGYGGSTRLEGRRVADVAPDLAAVLDHLGAERCVTLGWSGGGPHALAAAALLPDRVAAATSVAGVAPYDAPGLDFMAGMGEDNVEEFGAAVAGAAQLAPALEAAAVEMLAGAGPAELIEQLSGLLPEVDRAALAGDAGKDLADHFAEAVRNGAHGWIDDDLAFVAPWGFDLDAITVPTFLWQGDADLMVPFAHGGWLAEHVPGTVAHLLPGEGHISVCMTRLDEVLDELVAAASIG